MRTLGNIVWLVFSGLWTAILYALAGLFVCLFVITIPFGIQLFKLAGFVLWPFGRTAVRRPGAGDLSLLGNVLWFLPGLVLAAGHVLAALACLAACVFVITIPIALPFAIANLKMVPMALFPFGREVVSAGRVAPGSGAIVVLNRR